MSHSQVHVLLPTDDASNESAFRSGPQNELVVPQMLTDLLSDVASKAAMSDLQEAKVTVELRGQIAYGGRGELKGWLFNLGGMREHERTITLRVEAKVGSS